jgi:hypothetical protein
MASFVNAHNKAVIYLSSHRFTWYFYGLPHKKRRKRYEYIRLYKGMKERRYNRHNSGKRKGQVQGGVKQLGYQKSRHNASEQTKRQRYGNGDVGDYINRIEQPFGSFAYSSFSYAEIMNDQKCGNAQSKACVDVGESRPYAQ